MGVCKTDCGTWPGAAIYKKLTDAGDKAKRLNDQGEQARRDFVAYSGLVSPSDGLRLVQTWKAKQAAAIDTVIGAAQEVSKDILCDGKIDQFECDAALKGLNYQIALGLPGTQKAKEIVAATGIRFS